MSAGHEDDGYETDPPPDYRASGKLQEEFEAILYVLRKALAELPRRRVGDQSQEKITGMTTSLSGEESEYWMDLLKLLVKAHSLALNIEKPDNPRIRQLSSLLGKLLNETFKGLPDESMYGLNPSLLSLEMKEDIDSSQHNRLYGAEPEGLSRREEGLRDAVEQRRGLPMWASARWISILKMFIRVLGWDDVFVTMLSSKGVGEIYDVLRNPLMKRILVFARLTYIEGEPKHDTERAIGSEGDEEYSAHAICFLISRVDRTHPWRITIFDSSSIYYAWLYYQGLGDLPVNRFGFLDRFLSTTDPRVFYDANVPRDKNEELMDYFESRFSHNTLQTLLLYITGANPGESIPGIDYPRITHQGMEERRCGFYASYYMFYYVLINRSNYTNVVTGQVDVFPPNIDISLFAQFMGRVIRIFHGANLQGLGQFKQKKLKGGAISDDINSEYEKMLNVFIKWAESFIHDKE